MSFFVFAAALIVVASVGGQTTDALPATVTLPPDLARVLTDYETAYPRGGAVVAELFAEDGFVLAGGRPPIRGRAAIAQYYGPSNSLLALRPFAYGKDGDIAYVLGGYASRRGEPDSGKFTLTLRRITDGRWMIVSDMDNGNTRLPR